MKKVILSAAALMIGAIGFAQVSGAPEAESQDPLVVPNNSANLNANKGKSEQFGDDHRVRVRQAGTKQSVYTYQANGVGTIGGNRAEVLQSGDINLNSGRLNAADVNQTGDENLSLTIQEGDRNNAVTNQGQTDLNVLSSGNQAYIRQGNNGNAEDNYAAIDQDGSDNQAKTLQTYDNNDAYTDQDGDNLRSRIQQIAAPDGSEGHWAFVDQQGDDNESWVLQEGDGARNYAHTAQNGLSNYADQYQTTDATSGDANRAQIEQGMTPFYSIVGFDGDLVSLKNDTYALDGLPAAGPNLYSEGAEAFQKQDGDDNQALIGQFGVIANNMGNYGEQDQTGDDNNSFIIQNLYGSAAGGGNKAQQYQNGDDNNAGIVQSGSGHKARQYQLGDDNLALTSQKGNGNKAFTFQYGDDNWVSTAQRGHDNRVVVSQYDGQSYIAEQNLYQHPQAGGNQIDVVQTDGSQSINDWLAEECDIDMFGTQTWSGTPSPSTPEICQDCN